jgi:hypothetical protein
MVRVEIKSAAYDRIEFEFEEFEVASDFVNLALNAAVGNVKVEIEKVAESVEGRPEEPETRFPEMEEVTEVPEEELASVEEYF